MSEIAGLPPAPIPKQAAQTGGLLLFFCHVKKKSYLCSAK